MTGTPRRTRSILIMLTLTLLLAIALEACGSPPGSSAAGAGAPTLKWTAGIVQPKGDAGFELMAREKGFFKKYGVDITYRYFTGNVQLMQALISGQIDSGECDPSVAFNAVLKGADLKIIGSTLPGMTYTLFAKKDITTMSELVGKTIGVSAPGSLPDMVVRAMMARAGVSSKSVKLASVGDDAQRIQALEAGKIDAAAASPQFVPPAQQAGFHVLAQASDLVPNYPRLVVIANGKSLQEKPQAAVGFLAGEMDGIRYALAHRSETLALTAKVTNVSPNNPGIAYMYDIIKSANAASPTCEIPLAKIEWLQNFRVQLGFQSAVVPASKIIDSSYHDQALKKTHSSS